MPELPEVETCRAAIAPELTGRRIFRFEHGTKNLRFPWPDPAAVQQLYGCQIQLVRRRAKYLILSSDHHHLLGHLGMSGQLFFARAETPWLKHEHWRLHADGKVLCYRDPRRFGFFQLHVGERAEAHPRLVHLGPEPLCESSFHTEYLASICRGSRRPIKSLIMDGRVVVGVGNIYASEALHRAGIHPFRQAGAIATHRLDRLVDGIRSVLKAAIAAGGTTLKDFQNVEGNPGYFRQELAVYGRAGAVCRRCSGTIRQRTLSNRATYWCARCQR